MPTSESSESRPSKRKRNASAKKSREVSQDLPAIRSDTIWFDDGNVVLHVENKMFRVHRGFIAANSGVFKDMFKLPQPLDDNSVNGCPVVRLPHDTEEDWENLLAMMYFPTRLHPSDDNLSPTCLISMLRLGRKYQFDCIFKQALARLNQEFPRTLEGYVLIFTSTHPALHTGDELSGCGDKKCAYMACSTWSLFDLTNVMIELGLLATLPIAYYLCSLRPGKTIWNGCPRPDRTTSVLSDHAKSVIFSCKETFRCSRLNFSWLYGFEADIPCIPEEDCDDDCDKHLIHLIRNIEARCIQGTHHALVFLKESYTKNLCQACVGSALESHHYEQQKFWDRLPKYFDLPDWVDLKD